MVVTQRGTQLYAQSLRGGSEKPDADGDKHGEGDKHQDGDKHEEAPAKSNGLVIPPWLLPVGGGAIVMTGGLWLLRKRFRSAPVDGEEDAYATNYDLSLPAAEPTEPEPYTNNHHSVPLSPAIIMGEKSRKGG